MARRLSSILLATALVVPALVVLAAAPAAATVFSNPGSITLNDPNTQNTGFNNAIASPYPSTIPVSGLTGTINHVAVTLSGVSYSYSQDIDALLVGPGGQKMIVVANLGPSGANHAVSNGTLTLSDSGTLPTMATPWGSSSTFKPVNFGGFNETWPSPAPTPPYADPGTTGTGDTFASTYNGTNPNGTWSLYVITTAGGDGTGAIAGGWSLDITTANVAATTTALSSNNNPSFTTAPGSSVTLTASVHKASDNNNISEGTVAFTDSGNPVSGCAAVAVSAGQASCTTSFTTEGVHPIVATYSGTGNFGPSSAGLTQVVNNHTTVTGSNFCNTGSIALLNPPNTNINANPYPSNLFVSGLSGTVNHAAVTLNNVTYSHSQDIDALLVGPGGQTLILVANLGPNSGPGASVSNATVTFSDAGVLPPSGMATSWSALTTVKPVNYGGFNETWGPPAPPAPYGDPGTVGTGATLASQFNGINGNGTWSLYVITVASGDGTGAIAGGWCANITTASAAASTTTAISSNNPSFTTAPGNSVTLTATVHKASDNSNINEGTVNFTDGGTTIAGCGAVAVSAGQAICTTSFSTEGSHPILAQYSGTVNFGASSASLTQVVNVHTTVTGNSYCNTGSIALNNPTNTTANATPYPSNVFVSGLSTNLLHLSVTLNNVSYSHAQDIDALLVGPGGQTFILVADAGPNTGGANSNVTLTLDDNAASTIGQGGPWGAPNSSVTLKPANYGGFNEVWGPPAPPGPYGNPGPAGGGAATLGSVFNGTNPNGTWSLYVITTAAGDGTGAIAGGWCVGLTVPQPPTITKAFGAPSIPLNGSTSMTIGITNPAGNTFGLTGVGVTDTLPAGLVVSTPNGLSNTCGGTVSAVAGSNTVSLTGGTIAQGGTCALGVNVTGVAAGTQVNTTGNVTSLEGGNGSTATATLTVVAPPVITKTFSPAAIPLNGTSTLSFSITNPTANTVALTGVGFTDNLPAGMVVATPNGLTGSCGGGTITAGAGSSTITLTGATLPVGASCTFSMNVTATTSGVLTNSVTVTSTNGGTGNTATATLSTATPPQITKSFGAAAIPLNGSTTLSFTITNPAANPGPLNGVAFTDNLPAGLVVATPNGLTGSCGGGTIIATAGSSTVSLTGATLTANGSCTFSVKVTGTTAGVKNNSVQVTSTDGGPGNTSSASITVVAPPAISKAFGDTTVPFGVTTTLTFNLSNPNTAVALSGVGFTDTLPAGLVVATPNGLTGSCGGGTITAVAGTGTITLSGATLAASGGCSFSVKVTAVSVGVKNNTTSTVTSTEGGNGGTATATLTVVKAPTITTVTATPATAGFGSPITFTATVVPAQPNNSGINPTGTVSFFLDGQATPVATVTLVGGQARFTTSGLGAGTHTVVAVYSGDANFEGSTSATAATVTLTCATTVTGNRTGTLVLGPGATCVTGAHITGSVIVPRGAAVDIESSTISGTISASGPSAFRLCGTTVRGSVTVSGATGFVLIGDPGDDACASNTIGGSLTMTNNTHGLEAIGNHVAGAVTNVGNSGAGAFPEDTAPDVSGNGP